MIKVIISGVNGRMGKAVEALCRADETVEVVGGIDINLGVPHEFPTADNAFALETRADVIIDFSHHTCAAALCDYAAKTGTPVVFATTRLHARRTRNHSESRPKKRRCLPVRICRSA